jgi:hypothetical protein
VEVTDKAFVKTYKFNFANEYITEEDASAIIAAIEEYNAECNSNLVITKRAEKKNVLIEDKGRGVVVKMIIHALHPDDEDD